MTNYKRRSGWVRRVTGHFSGFVSTGSWVCGAGAGQLSHYAVTFGSGDWRLSCRGGPHTHLKHWRPCLESHDPMGLLIINQATISATTRQLIPVCLFQFLVFYSHMLHVLFCITYGVNMHMLLGKKENALNFCQYEWGAPLQVIKTNVHGQIQTLYLIIITASYNSQARVTRGVNGN